MREPNTPADRRRCAVLGPRPGPAVLTVNVLPVADVLQVAAGVLAAQVRVGTIGLQPGMSIPPELRAGRHAARGSVPHLRRPDYRGARLAPGAGRGVERRPARRRGRTEAWPARSAAAAAAGPRHGRRAGLRRAGGRQLPRPPRRPGPGGLSTAEERRIRANAAAAPTSPRRSHGGRRAGRFPALPSRRPGPGGGFGKRFRFKQRRRLSARAAAVSDGAAGVGGRGPRPGAERRGTARRMLGSRPAPPRHRPFPLPWKQIAAGR